jgi:hypothetical protein
MPDRRESIPAAPIPRIDPALWEEGEGFRETLLLHYTEPEANATLRRLGKLVFDVSLECAGAWPHHPHGETHAELSAAVADLRHLQGFLAAVGQEHEISSLSVPDEVLSHLAARQSAELARIADEIERALRERG